MRLGVSEIARILEIDRQLVKQWAFHFKEYLSVYASPSKETPRQFTLEDLRVLIYVHEYWEDDPDFESIRIGLNCGEHLDSSYYEDILTSVLPIFQEPPEELDETWRHGSLLGGMCGDIVDPFTLADSYKLASDILIESALSSGEPYELLYPVIYNYRHATELYLKAILLPTQKNHNLKALFQDLRELLAQKYSVVIPSWFENVILAFDDFDPSSTTFRYGDTGVFSHSTRNRGEFWIDLHHLKRLMAWVTIAFQRIRVLQEQET